MEFLNLLFWIILAVAVITIVVFYLRSRKKGGKVESPPEVPSSESPEEPPEEPGV